MSEDDLLITKSRILDLFAELNDTELNSIEEWISTQSYKKDLNTKKKLLKSEKCLVKIADAIKKLVPFEAEMHTEKIAPPTVGDQADCNSVNTCHLDEFLYDQEEFQNMIKKGKLKKSYCLDCTSRNIQDLTYTSHSMSKQALQFIFKVFLPSDLVNKQVLDVGSRLGAVLYGAYHFSNASKIIGIEMNKEWCELQDKIIKRFSMDSSRIQVINSDIMERSDVVAQSDVIVINVLDFFVDLEKHKEMWHYFKKYMKKGCYLVCNRSMMDTLGNLGLLEEFVDWLTITKPNQMENEVFFDVEDCNELFLYSVN